MVFFIGSVPIIRSPRGNAAEMVAEKLDKKLRENLRDTRNSLFLTDASQAGHFRYVINFVSSFIIIFFNLHYVSENPITKKIKLFFPLFKIL